MSRHVVNAKRPMLLYPEYFACGCCIIELKAEMKALSYDEVSGLGEFW